MTRTPVSLLERLRTAPDDDAWNQFVELYGPLVYRWLRFRFELPEKDAEDVSQEVLAAVVREMPTFHYRAGGSFRAWLFRIVFHRVQSLRREARPRPVDPADLAQTVDHTPDPPDELARRWEDEHDRHVLCQALALIEREFEPSTWQAFRLIALEGLPAPEAGARAGLTANAARIAKYRVLRRLRQVVEGLVD
jgi:RNA polymerase sigma-70 factor (ECF subfamily)